MLADRNLGKTIILSKVLNDKGFHPQTLETSHNATVYTRWEVGGWVSPIN